MEQKFSFSFLNTEFMLVQGSENRNNYSIAAQFLPVRVFGPRPDSYSRNSSVQVIHTETLKKSNKKYKDMNPFFFRNIGMKENNSSTFMLLQYWTWIFLIQ
jgi:hypothetical protein